MERSNSSIIAVAWFRPEQWSDLQRLCPDLDDTYQEWLAKAEAAIEVLERSAEHQVVKIVLTVDLLRRWKRATGRKVDSKARRSLAANIAAQNHRASH